MDATAYKNCGLHRSLRIMSPRSKDILAGPTCSTSNARDRFQQLVQALKLALGPSSGLDSADVNPLDLQNLMECYTSDAEEWTRYAYQDSSRGYTRNLVDTGNGKSNLLILVWTPGGSSPIHDHSNAHCVMKVLKGSLKETLYSWPDQSTISGGRGSPLQTKKETVYTTNQVTYMSDNLGLHKISNPDIQEFAVSLHLYTPPNAARVGCHVYDEQSGKSFHVQQCDFFSKLGHKS